MSIHAIGLLPDWDFADRLRKARRISGMSQEQFARALGIGGPRYSAWESGRNTPTDFGLVCGAVSRLTGVSYEWLLGSDGPHDDGLPHLDSNQEPFDYTARISRFPARHVADHRAA
jgi:transcriptional regulator with XRE-family HTH domain